MPVGLAAGAPLVLDLLNYIEQVEKLKSKSAFSVPGDYFVAYQHELVDLPGLQFNVQAGGDDIWLRLPRLKEIGAPEPDEQLRPWITVSRSTDKSPELKPELVILDGRTEIGRRQIEAHPEVRELFDWYVEYFWKPWAVAERPRRKAIGRYNQLFSLQQAISSEGAETPLELVWGIGVAAWKKEHYATPVKYPLLIQSCEITLNEKTFDLELRPRDVEPKLDADCYAEMEIPGVTQLEAHWRSALASGANRVNPFESSTFEGILRTAVGHLDPTGAYENRTNNVAAPTPGEKLLITNTWVIFGRKRSADIFLEDIRKLRTRVEEAESLPSVVRALVEPGDAEVRIRPEQPFRGLSTSDAGMQPMELYFPMPYNDEQVSIVQKLHANDGVVVQGPPGTGKTHTIANVICHYLALGKRVLVTAKGESALAVLQEKLPDRIRPLSVALLSDERDGMKQFEHSIQAIAANVASINPTRSASMIAAAEGRLNHLHAQISEVDRQVAAYAGKHMRNYVFRGKEISPEEMAKLVFQQTDEHQWFDDEPPPPPEGHLPFGSVDIDALRSSRIRVGSDIGYVACSLPTSESFPSWTDLLGLHRDLVRAKSIDRDVVQGSLLPLIDSRLDTFEKAQSVVAFLDARRALKSRLAESRQSWVDSLRRNIANMQPTDPRLTALIEICSAIRALEDQRRVFVANAIELPADAERNEDCRIAVQRLVDGKSAFSLPFGKGEARTLIASAKVAGGAPKEPSDWERIAKLLEWRISAHKAIAKWSSLSAEFGLQATGPNLDVAVRELNEWRINVEDLLKLTFEHDTRLHPQLMEVLGKSIADRIWEGGETFVTLALASLQAHVDKGRLAYAMKRVQEVLRKLDANSGAIVAELRTYLSEALGDTTADESALQKSWSELQDRLSKLNSLRPSLEDIARVTLAIDSAGARKWATRLRTEAVLSEHDPQTPVSWQEAWNWRQAVMFLDRIDGHQLLRKLFNERNTLTTALARTYQELVAEKTWLGVFANSPDVVRQALQAYLNAVQAMGAGTGVRAVRHRRNARAAMIKAYKAVPCWVLPQWRVSETIPPELGLFDVVVIDEASQSDIWALPALLRGKKVLVVGDHKQVSPSAIGTAEEKIKELTHRFLSNQPHGSEMTPDKSIYDLARVVFAGNSVMLKEHFRCVPAIIEFSNRTFYEGDIRPLRLPKANERLDPPLVDVFVKGGHRRGDENPPEAKAIVDEIESILADSRFDGRSIGVVTLLGNTQAALIHKMIGERISPVDVVSRKISVGPPPVFQGRERDIMLISMVVGPGGRAAANRSDMFQRFNVALSRARDRMYLFRSVTDAEFREDSLNGKVIGHFKKPFRQDARVVEALRDRCESGFEKDMFDELVKRGFRVEPQVPCGGYRIDFVVEGKEGRRLAIECDGDRFHGPGQWHDDMMRQRVLERAGWTFWRCFASTFVRRRQVVVEDLLQTLAGLGIEPIGSESVDNTMWVQYKEVDPLGIETTSEVA